MPYVTWGRGKKNNKNTVRLDLKFTNILGVRILYDFKLRNENVYITFGA